jgi:hypothetical protein
MILHICGTKSRYGNRLILNPTNENDKFSIFLTIFFLITLQCLIAPMREQYILVALSLFYKGPLLYICGTKHRYMKIHYYLIRQTKKRNFLFFHYIFAHNFTTPNRPNERVIYSCSFGCIL